MPISNIQVFDFRLLTYDLLNPQFNNVEIEIENRKIIKELRSC